MTAPSVVLLGTLACEQEQTLRRKLDPSVGLIPVPNDAPDSLRRQALATARIMVTLHYNRTMPPAPHLRFLQAGGAGYDQVDLSYLPPGTIVSNAYGHEDAVAEYVILAMLLWGTRFLAAEQSFRAGSWALGGRTGGPLVEELGGKTVGLIGFGHIGRAVARRARAMDARVVVCSRTVPPPSPNLAWARGMDRLEDLLRESDFVVVCCGLGPDTANLIDATRFRQMRSHAMLINVARGAIVNEEALYQALRDQTIAGAAIDTWYHYPTVDDPAPRPSRFPFHELPNLYMTPHSSAWTTGMIERRWTTIADNIGKVLRGEAPVNIVYRAPEV
jgi:phosphoglycerate dehydrogenase-like enzyme